MKSLKIVLIVALVIVAASIFAGAVSAADQTDSQLIVKDENEDFGAIPQTTGQNKSENISKLDLNGVAKPEATNVENSTTSEQVNLEVTDVIPVQSNNSTDLKSENSRELTIDEMKNIKGKDWIEDAKRFVAGVIEPIGKLFRPGAIINASGNNSSWNVYVDVHAASKIRKSKR